MATSSAVSLPGRSTIAFARQGDPSRVPLVFLPGPTDSWVSYRPVLDRLPRRIHPVAVSQRGHGDSTEPLGGYRVDDLAADVPHVLDALDLSEAVLVGHSGSCLVARRVAIDHPERVAGLVFEASPSTLAVDPAFSEFVETVASTLEDPIPRAFARSFVVGTSSTDVAAEVMDELVDEVLKVPARVWHEMFAALRRYDDRAELGRVSAPALLIWGDRDALVGIEAQRDLLERMPRATMLTYEGVGHAPRWEQPARFVDDVVAFVDRVAAGTA